MLSGKDRSFLKGRAHHLEPLLHVGKAGITQEFLREADKVLEDHELVKIAFLDASELKPKQAAEQILQPLEADFVGAVGKKLVIYRPSNTIEPKDRIHIPKWRKNE